MILANTESYGDELVADAYLIPTTTVGKTAGDLIKQYIALTAIQLPLVHLQIPSWVFNHRSCCNF